MIVILTSPHDPHLPFVTKHLKQHEYVVLDTGVIADGARLTYDIDDDGLVVRYEGKELRDVTGVWYRRPRIAKSDLHLNIRPDYRDYADGALQKVISQLYALFDDAVWVSSLYAIRRAENKVFQLKVAQRLGFNVPETCVTSDSEAAEAFVGTHGNVIVKSLSDHWPKPTKGHAQPAFYARKISAGDSVNYDGLHLAPAIFQRLVEPGFDIRVTVIGQRVFAAKITLDNQATQGVRDWRLGHAEGELCFESYELEPDIAEKCVQLTGELGLNFGAIDLVQAKDGSTWFLEINSNGQWGFIELATGQPLGKAMAELLRRGKGKTGALPRHAVHAM